MNQDVRIKHPDVCLIRLCQRTVVVGDPLPE
jgi:hypothetical protein